MYQGEMGRASDKERVRYNPWQRCRKVFIVVRSTSRGRLPKRNPYSSRGRFFKDLRAHDAIGGYRIEMPLKCVLSNDTIAKV